MAEARWVREESRRQWAALGTEQRDELFRSARRGEPHPDPEIALSAVHWARAVLGPPRARRSYPLGDLLLHFAPAAMFENVYNGTKQHDFRPTVRRAARRVEAANLDHLRGLGIDTDSAV
ncbi:hypothetical protein [Streptacidiphilus sp. P02-A3a]|uniref:hypothetical protein n=1 Tax=Streptacidiphilus sp. P02-A3a TaxID=2704468 RepID=UPI0015FDC100|nr:hypothetical protein [Streptacidiphilus sp. P02-A3a]QMU67471.1 hypothetical protein GXP74_03785 [Streptacidiphilus sp. P02-A3a]